jgi:archaellum biogenesis ATPase FlaH
MEIVSFEKSFQNLMKNKNSVFLCRSKNPVEFISHLGLFVSKNFKKVCYVSIDKSYSILIKKFQSENIDCSKWLFIDCISSILMIDQVPSAQCKYLSSPQSLTDISWEMMQQLNSADIIILDNVSSLLIYNDDVSVLSFLNRFMSQVRKSNIRVAYLLSHDTNKEVMEDLALFADSVNIL